jgi:hypothetical protein
VHEVRELIERSRRLLHGDIAVLMKKEEGRDGGSEASALPTPVSMETFDYDMGGTEASANHMPDRATQGLPMPRRPRLLD